MLNKRAVYEPKFTRNPEGAVAHDLSGNALALFTMASGLRLDKDFYHTPDQKLEQFAQLLDSIKNVRLISAYAFFLSQYLGIKLSPVIMLTHVAITRQKTLTSADRQTIARAMRGVFDRPDKFANAFGYAKYRTGELKRLPPFFKRMLKESFEGLKEHTLVKNRMVSREIKTSDLIKLLHPRPRNARMSQVYKAVIENDTAVVARDKSDMVRVLSDSTLSKDEKKAVIGENLDKTPINALIRNLRNVSVTAENIATLSKRFNEVLRVVGGIPDIRVVNPFDLLKAGLNATSVKIAGVIDNALYKYMSQVDTLEGKKVTFLVDISGSMNPSDTEVVALYMALLSPALRDADLQIRMFGNKTRYDKREVTNAYKFSKSLVANFGNLKTQFRSRREGTALADAVSIADKSNPDLIVVFSDEVTWADKGFSSGWGGIRTTVNANAPVLAINPRPKGFTAFDPNSNTLRIGSLDAKIFYYMPLLANEGQFNSWVMSLLGD